MKVRLERPGRLRLPGPRPGFSLKQAQHVPGDAAEIYPILFKAGKDGLNILPEEHHKRH
ncbi:MAG: hypothetical protein U0Z75_05955 [Deinococcaceae bacterium]